MTFEMMEIDSRVQQERWGGNLPSTPNTSNGALQDNRHAANCAQQHICSRFCTIEHVFGNLYRCTSTGCSHVCDMNCNQRIFYDNFSTICRLSRKIFSNAEVEEARRQALLSLRKRGSGHLEIMTPGAGEHESFVSDDSYQMQEQLSAKRPSKSPLSFGGQF